MLLDAVTTSAEGIVAHLTPIGVLASICVVALTALIYYFHGSLFSGPGPWGVPILGYYPFLKKGMHIQLKELNKLYGHVYKFNVCGTTFVYMDSIEAIRESHITKSEDFPHRIDTPSLFTDAFDGGIFIVKGEHWKVMRKFVHQGLREIGLSPSSDKLKELIEVSVKSTLDRFSESKGEPINITSWITKEAARIVGGTYLGPYVTEKDTEKLDEAYADIFVPFVDRSTLLYGSFARTFLMPWMPGYSRFCKGNADMRSILHRIVDEHKRDFTEDHPPRDFIDLYLAEKAARERKGDPSAKYFTDHCLVTSLVQMYGDGASGVGFFISAYLYELGKYRAVQDAIHEEIMRVVGSERLPTLADRSEMPYTNSAIKELLRHTVLFPILPGLECVRDTTVQGVHVPKGAVVVLNYWGVHHNPELYDKPEEFDAERFLPDKTKVEPPLSFGIGKRGCAGEGIVMAEFFMFVTAILQNFIITAVVDQDGSSHTAEESCYVRAIPRPKGRGSSSTSV